MPTLRGSCICREIEYQLKLASIDDARTSLCHCRNCKVYIHLRLNEECHFTEAKIIEQKAFGTNYGLTAKVPKDKFNLTKGIPKEHVANNGSGAVIHREFCQNCGSFILEYGDAVKEHFRYICVGSLDDPEALPPKGEFFCRARASWMPEIPSEFSMLISWLF
ncbi:Glutathione-dependent formaldehyde-activating enzyme/centromere protein V [Penicillium italicum]|uniref:Glutathione-dependent formaldehyde-activating enzyme/centromere protein V n=1 Tax=Penicillium italicum TaxID=40296 RepID=A0A0A2KZ79_PENIT|nr:Glutathione-dependent formaldehyde-activating enzyme/centromere protein V [Penicillium italicum]